MAKNKKIKEKKQTPFLIHVLKSPYYLAREIYRLNKKAQQASEEREIDVKRDKIIPKYEDFKIIKTLSGDYKEWENETFNSESKIGIILGARGSGKSAFGIKFLENMKSKTKNKFYSIGFKKDEMPSWINSIENINEIKNDSTVLIDEGGILFNARSAMAKPNKLMGELILIARHKNLNILFISQNSSNLDVNIIRQADFLVLKPTSLLQKDFERKKIQEIYKDVEKHFNKYKSDRGLTHIYSDTFRGFVSNPLPSFWNVSLSKSFR